MPSVYRDFATKIDSLQGLVFNTLSAESSMRQVPAGRIMLQAKPKNFTQLFRAFVDGYKNIWTWNPKKTPSSGEVLDGVQTYGQCAAFSRALHLLAVAPKPYGLGLSPTQVQVDSYKGKHNQGFISRHDKVHFNLASNVITPGGGNPPTFTDLYSWENHFVVKYLGRYYDPSYDDEYTTKDEMALYGILPGTENRGQEVYEKGVDRMGKTHYFKQNFGALGARAYCSEGPYASLPGE